MPLTEPTNIAFQSAYGVTQHIKSTSGVGTDANPYVLGVGQSNIIVAVTPVLDTGVFQDGDSMCPIVEVASAVRSSGGCAILQSIVVNDKDDQGVAFDIYLFAASVTLPTPNAAWDVSDADMAQCLGFVQIATGDYLDAGANRQATKANLGIMVAPTTGTSLYLALRSRGAGTYTASGVTLKLGFVRD